MQERRVLFVSFGAFAVIGGLLALWLATASPAPDAAVSARAAEVEKMRTLLGERLRLNAEQAARLRFEEYSFACQHVVDPVSDVEFYVRLEGSTLVVDAMGRHVVPTTKCQRLQDAVQDLTREQ